MAPHVDQYGKQWRLIRPNECRGYLATHRGIWEGYCEARSGKPLDPFAFSNDHGHQIRYEEGRRIHALVQAREGHVPEWSDRERSPPLVVSVVIENVRGGGGL